MSFDRDLGMEISDRYGIPTEMISCPGCGRVYVGKVCTACQECSKCCRCKPDEQKLVSANVVKQAIADNGGEWPEELK